MINRRLIRALVGVVVAGSCAACVPKEGVDGVEKAATSSCTAERHSVEQAVEAYYVLEGAFPTSEADLVPNYMRAESVSMDLDTAGNVVAAPGSGCI
ncbi:MAG: hypothetical protein ABL953_11040 [Ilumatobacteraceae bacterium]